MPPRISRNQLLRTFAVRLVWLTRGVNPSPESVLEPVAAVLVSAKVTCASITAFGSGSTVSAVDAGRAGR